MYIVHRKNVIHILFCDQLEIMTEFHGHKLKYLDHDISHE